MSDELQEVQEQQPAAEEAIDSSMDETAEEPSAEAEPAPRARAAPLTRTPPSPPIPEPRPRTSRPRRPRRASYTERSRPPSSGITAPVR